VALETTWASELEGSDAREYDRFVLEAPSGHFAQTRAWAPVARRSRPCELRFFVAREGGRIVGSALVQRGRAGPLRLPFAHVERGPVCARTDDVARVLAALVAETRRRGVARLTVMPYWSDESASHAQDALRRARFRDVQTLDGAHAVTLRVDLSAPSDDAVLAGGSRAQLRRLWREALRAGATVRMGEREDMAAHRSLVQERLSAEGKKDRPSSWYDALSGLTSTAWASAGAGPSPPPAAAALFVCEHGGAAVGTAIVLRHGPLATYAQGATSPSRMPFSKSVLPLVAAIRWARAQGCREFDLGGVPVPEDNDPKRLAIAHFKAHFSETRVRLVRAHGRWF
jgi:hypothetical protein